ncbi:MAG: hypothetical protein ACRETB_07675 [Steroidobacteraceae bacterium]
MRELVIVVSDLYFASDAAGGMSAEASAVTSLPGLARMARFGAASALPRGWRSWLAAWLGGPALAEVSAAAVAAAALLPGAAASEWVWLADPVHLQAGLQSVHLAPQGLLRLDAPAQAQLASAFNAEFAATRFRLTPTRAGRFLAAGPAMPEAAARTDPARWLGSSLAEALAPAGAPGALRRLGGEIETWLHEHPLNARRVREGKLPLSALWLWGGGPPLEAPMIVREARSAAAPGERAAPGSDERAVAGSEERATIAAGRHSTAFFGDDPFVEGLAHVLRASCAPAARGLAAVMATAKGAAATTDATADAATGIPPGAAATTERAVVHIELFSADAGSHGIPTSPLQALAAFDRDWIEPALEQLDRRAILRLAVMANDRQLSLAARDSWKRWRRRRAALAALSAP